MTLTQILSWVVVAIGLVGFYLAGRKIWWAWYINLFVQVGWLVYALVSNQYAFIVSAVVYGIVFGRNAYLWSKNGKLKAFEYRKKPVTIQAVQFLNYDSVDGLEFGSRGDVPYPPDWIREAILAGKLEAVYDYTNEAEPVPVIRIETLEGRMTAAMGDWIIRGVEGELYSCKPDIFDKTYDVA